MAREVEGILSLWRSHAGVRAKMESLKRKGESKNTERMQTMGETANEMLKIINAQLSELENYAKIAKRFNTIVSGADL